MNRDILLELFAALTGTDRKAETASLIDKFKSRKEAGRLSIGKANTEIQRLETALGLKHRPPTFNLVRAERLIASLTDILAEKGQALPAQVALPVVAVAPVAAASIAQTVKTMAADDMPFVTTAADFLRMKVEDQKQFILAGGKMSYAEFSKLNAALKSFYCFNGGKLLPESFQPVIRAPGERCARSKPTGVDRLGLKLSYAGNGPAISRPVWDAMTPTEKNEAMRNGATVEEI